MFIVYLTGGLGNQMFQYAAGKALALRQNRELKIDVSHFQTPQSNETKREFELAKVFKHNFNIATFSDIKQVLGFQILFHKNPFLRRIWKRLPFKKNWVVEPHFSYWPAFFSNQKDCLIEGYWQSYKYFESYADNIRQSFNFKSDAFKNFKLLKSIKGSNSVSIHIRRGDYVKNKTTAKFHGICEADYYLKAIELIRKEQNNIKFFVFSDDISAAKKILNGIEDVSFVEGAPSQHHFDMMLMSNCKHHIIANSTFSWWGAWLNQNPQKIVIAPQKWFASGLPDQDIIPETWLRM
jgi:hypothetical protein